MELLACRICLATEDVKLYNMFKFNLINAYENLTGIQVSTSDMEDNLPQFICSYCSSLLFKCVAFKEKCLKTQFILQCNPHKQITKEDLRSVHPKYKLPYSLSTNYPTIKIDFPEPVIKEEVADPEYFDTEINKDLNTDITFSPDIGPDISDIKIEKDETNKANNGESDEDNTQEFEIEINSEVKTEVDSVLKDMLVKILTTEEQIMELQARKTSSNYMNSFYKCNYCYKGFMMAWTFKNHMAKHDPERGTFVCEVCKTRWSEARTLRAHILNTHEKKYVCKLCDHQCRNGQKAKEHLKWHSGFMYDCKICGALFAKPTSLLTHIRLQHPTGPSCEICGESFIGELGLRMHKKKIHKTENFTIVQCDHCKIKFYSIQALTKHFELSKTRSNDFCDGSVKSCAYCGDGFETEDILKEHLKNEHGDEGMVCEECSRSFTSARSLEVHRERVHLRVKRGALYRQQRRIYESVVCEVCGYKCNSRATLISHQRRHTGEKPYHCPHCPKEFSVMQRLQIHIRTHTGERPCKCPHCPKAFKHKAALNRHVRVHTGEKPYSCYHCEKSFSQSNTMKIHVRTVHFKQPTPYRSRRKNNVQ